MLTYKLSDKAMWTGPELVVWKLMTMKGRNYLILSSIFDDVDAKVTGFVGWSFTVKLRTSGLE